MQLDDAPDTGLVGHKYICSNKVFCRLKKSIYIFLIVFRLLLQLASFHATVHSLIAGRPWEGGERLHGPGTRVQAGAVSMGSRISVVGFSDLHQVAHRLSV